jgi:hypothetical protein
MRSVHQAPPRDAGKFTDTSVSQIESNDDDRKRNVRFDVGCVARDVSRKAP